MKTGIRHHLLAISRATLLAAIFTQATYASSEPEQEQAASNPRATGGYTAPQSASDTVTIITGVTPGYKKPLFGCLPACNEPNTPLAVSYPESTDIATEIMQRMPEKFFYAPYDAQRISEARHKHNISIRTIYLGTPEEYQKVLAANNEAAAAQDRKNMANLAVFLLTMGKIDTSKSSGTPAKNITEKHVSNLPPNARKILVTQISFSPYGYQVLETMTAAYSDIENSELRKINYEQGIRRAIGLIE